MTISTGSGDYNALMTAIVTHAITDGWTTSGGTWPISKGNVRGVVNRLGTRCGNDGGIGRGDRTDHVAKGDGRACREVGR